MGLFKRFINNEGDKEAALAFKNKLKYGSDIRAQYNDACERSQAAWKDRQDVKDKLAEIYKFKERKTYQDWSSFNISTSKDCKQSPIGKCLYISYYGDESKRKDDKMYCLCCKEALY